ncbi:hypothetical protein AJR17_004285 [Shigella boydii]|uniref:Hok/Gef family protein n=1 Tax=Shigella boydii TaxID=621 RepID=A0A1S9JLI0_SHIBO|nr:hypothetical protein AJR17_004285 [Shigella boydii]
MTGEHQQCPGLFLHSQTLVTRKDLCEVRIRTGQTEVAVFTAYEPEE